MILLLFTFIVQGTEQIEGIVLECKEEEEPLSAKAFMKMERLRLLKLRNLRLSQSLQYLSNKLRYLEWDGYPFKYFPSTFQPDKLIELHMRCGNMEKLWEGIKVSITFYVHHKYSEFILRSELQPFQFLCVTFHSHSRC